MTKSIIIVSLAILSICQRTEAHSTGEKAYSQAVISKDSVTDDRLDRATENAQKLTKLQKKANHLWRRAGWWNSANILESMIDYHRLSGRDFQKEIQFIFRRNLYNRQFRYVNVSAFDDNEWWALTWLKAYDMTGNKRYKEISEHIFEDMIKRSWDEVCGGGMEWSAVKHYKNAVTNELFMVLAARLALKADNAATKKYYHDWAVKEWNWLRNSKMFTDSLWVSDGLNQDCSCGLNAGLDLTYNQGIVLGGLTYLYQLTSDHSYLDLAQNLAHASIKKYSNANEVLTEHGEVNNDKVQFKGIYIRYLAILNTELHDEDIKKFILHNADYAWLHCRNNEGLSDWDWNGPYKNWSGSAQGSLMDLLNAALMQQ